MGDKSKVDPVTRRVAERYTHDVFAMSNLRPSDTGVDGVVIWVSVGEFGGADAQHGPRIKVSPGTKVTPEARQNAVTVKLTAPPEFLGELPGRTKEQVLRFLERNLDMLLRYWNGEISTKEMLDQIQKV